MPNFTRQLSKLHTQKRRTYSYLDYVELLPLNNKNKLIYFVLSSLIRTFAAELSRGAR